MANDLNILIPKVLARGLMALRERTIMPRLVNGDFSADAAKKGATIDVPVHGAKVVSDVTPSNTPPVVADTVVDTVQITLDQWKKVDFRLDDKEMTKINAAEEYVPGTMNSAIIALAEYVNAHILRQYKRVYGFVGDPGTTPFGEAGSAKGVKGATLARKVLNEQKAPKDSRRGVLDFTAEAEALGLAQFSDAEKIGNAGVKIEGEIGRKFAIDWAADDAVMTHVSGTLTNAPTVTGVVAAGGKTVNMTCGAADAIALLEGDIITFAGDSQTYAVTADVTIGNSATGDILISPGKVVATAGSEAIAVKGDHVVNLTFHRDAFAYAQRPMTMENTGGTQMFTMTDPVTGISLRLEVSRQYKQTVWEFDILFGANLIRPEYAARLAG